ncbi:MAG TPA: hypothetical protein VFN67_20265 [Polyangiales bacterium]|nr:hypothetical protein [Polyangiales bacterium]
MSAVDDCSRQLQRLSLRVFARASWGAMCARAVATLAGVAIVRGSGDP